MDLIDQVKFFFRNIEEIQRNKAAEAYELEVKELNNIFSLMLFGSFIGIPSTPSHICNEVLSEMPKEFEAMINKISTANDPLSELFSVLDIA